VSNLSIQIPVGVSLGILGGRGSGKSTLIKLLTGATQPDSGRVIRRCHVSFPIGSSGPMQGRMTGRQNLAFLARLYGVDVDDFCRFVARMSELGPMLEHPFSTYSGERRTRFLFSLVYGLPFDIYVSDGLLLGGESWFRARCEELLHARLRTAGLVLATTNPTLIRRYVSVAGLLAQGTLRLFNTPDEAIEAYEGDVPASQRMSDEDLDTEEPPGDPEYVE
jgi:capsular polysaccharide transport system ATP-binding protein